MSGIIEALSAFMRDVGWMIGLGLFLIFTGLFGFALINIVEKEDNEGGLNHDDADH